jgi:hypothetical protein
MSTSAFDCRAFLVFVSERLALVGRNALRQRYFRQFPIRDTFLLRSPESSGEYTVGHLMIQVTEKTQNFFKI